MKNQIIILIALLISLNSFSSENTIKDCKTEIKEVKLYLNGGQIHRQGEVNLKKGLNIIHFSGISTNIETASIQLKFESDIIIRSISTELIDLGFNEMYKDTYKKDEKDAIEDSINMYNKKIETLNNKVNAYQAELKLIESNYNINQSQSTLSMEKLAEMAAFVNKRTFEISENINNIQDKISTLEKIIDNLKDQVFKIINAAPVSKKIIVEAVSEIEASTKVDIKYNVKDAAWKPVYEVKSDGIESKLNLEFRAKILNHTGNDWENVKLSCSTTDLAKGIDLPILKPWGLYPKKQKKYENTYSDSVIIFRNYNDGSIVSDVDKNSIRNITLIEVTDLSKTFIIEGLQSVKHYTKTTSFKVAEYNLDVKYNHYTIPKLDNGVFLTAEIDNWEKLNLINGELNIYYQNNYIGQIYLNTNKIEDELTLPLGRVESVLVSRLKKVDHSKKRIIGSKTVETLSFEITLKNNGNKEVSIDLFDQLPVAQDSDISVEAVELSNANHNPQNGKLSWENIKLKPDEIKLIILTFKVEYPEYKNVILRETRTINCPTF